MSSGRQSNDDVYIMESGDDSFPSSTDRDENRGGDGKVPLHPEVSSQPVALISALGDDLTDGKYRVHKGAERHWMELVDTSDGTGVDGAARSTGERPGNCWRSLMSERLQRGFVDMMRIVSGRELQGRPPGVPDRSVLCDVQNSLRGAVEQFQQAFTSSSCDLPEALGDYALPDARVDPAWLVEVQKSIADIMAHLQNDPPKVEKVQSEAEKCVPSSCVSAAGDMCFGVSNFTDAAAANLVDPAPVSDRQIYTTGDFMRKVGKGTEAVSSGSLTAEKEGDHHVLVTKDILEELYTLRIYQRNQKQREMADLLRMVEVQEQFFMVLLREADWKRKTLSAETLAGCLGGHVSANDLAETIKAVEQASSTLSMLQDVAARHGGDAGGARLLTEEGRSGRKRSRAVDAAEVVMQSREESLRRRVAELETTVREAERTATEWRLRYERLAAREGDAAGGGLLVQKKVVDEAMRQAQQEANNERRRLEAVVGWARVTSSEESLTLRSCISGEEVTVHVSAGLDNSLHSGTSDNAVRLASIIRAEYEANRAEKTVETFACTDASNGVADGADTCSPEEPPGGAVVSVSAVPHEVCGEPPMSESAPPVLPATDQKTKVNEEPPVATLVAISGMEVADELPHTTRPSSQLDEEGAEEGETTFPEISPDCALASTSGEHTMDENEQIPGEDVSLGGGIAPGPLVQEVSEEDQLAEVPIPLVVQEQEVLEGDEVALAGDVAQPEERAEERPDLFNTAIFFED